MKIQTKLISGLLLIALFVGIIGIIFLNISQNELQNNIGQSSVVLTQQTLDKIDRSIYNRIEELQVYSQNTLLQEIVLKSNEEFNKLNDIQEYINQKDEEWTSKPKETITPFMQELIENELFKEVKERLEFYKEKYSYNVFGEIFVTNKYGANAAQTGKTTDYYQADEDWWNIAKEEGLYIGDVEYDESTAMYSTDIGIRIDDKNGEFVGVIKAVLNIQEIINLIKDLETMKDNEMYGVHGHENHESMHFKLLTKEGNLIYSSEEFKFLEKIDNGEFIKKAIEKGDGYFILKGDEGHIEKELFSHAHSQGYKDYKGLDWVLMTEYDTKEILAPVIKLRNTLIITTIITVVIAIVSGLFLTKTITRPIHELTKWAKKIKKGNLNVKCKINTKDEIEQLADTFENMRLGLKDRNDLLGAMLKTFKGKFGNIARIAMRKNIKELAEKNPRIIKIIPKDLAKSIEKSMKKE